MTTIKNKVRAIISPMTPEILDLMSSSPPGLTIAGDLKYSCSNWFVASNTDPKLGKTMTGVLRSLYDIRNTSENEITSQVFYSLVW